MKHVNTYRSLICLTLFLATPVFAGDGDNVTIGRTVQAPVYLGVNVNRKDLSAGALVESVIRKSPADLAGLKAGDRVHRIGELKVNNVAQVRAALKPQRHNSVVKLTISRGETSKEVEVKLVARPTLEALFSQQLLGFPVPDFKIQYLAKGKGTVSTADVTRGKWTVIDFWATWCGPCHKLSPHLVELSASTGGKLHVVGVSSESRGTINRFIQKRGAKYPLAYDVGGAGHALANVASFPSMILVDPDGIVRGTYVGIGIGPLTQDVKRLVTP